MDTAKFNQTYFPFLIETLRHLETEIETSESYINEQNYEEFFGEYRLLQSALSDLQREIHRVGKALGMKKKQIRDLINP